MEVIEFEKILQCKNCNNRYFKHKDSLIVHWKTSHKEDNQEPSLSKNEEPQPGTSDKSDRGSSILSDRNRNSNSSSLNKDKKDKTKSSTNQNNGAGEKLKSQIKIKFPTKKPKSNKNSKQDKDSIEEEVEVTDAEFKSVIAIEFYKCRNCSYKNQSIVAMICHERVHSKEKYAKCLACSSFKAKSRLELEEHYKSVHPDNNERDLSIN